MDEKRVTVDIEEIMRGIRRQIRMDEDLKSLPAFENIPLRDEQPAAAPPAEVPPAGEVNWDEFYKSLEYANTSYAVPYYWVMGPRGPKTFIKRVVRKINKCLIPPILEKQSTLNAMFVRCHNAFRHFSEEVRRRLAGHDESVRQLQEKDAGLENELGRASARIEAFGGEMRRFAAEAGDRAERLNELMVRSEDILHRLDALQEQLGEKEDAQHAQLLRDVLSQHLAETEQRQAEMEQRWSEMQQRQTEAEQRWSEMQQRWSEMQQRRAETERRLAEAEQRQAEAEQRQAEMEQRRAETERRLAEAEQRQAETEQRQNERADRMERRITSLDRQSDAFSASAAKTLLTYKEREGLPVSYTPPVREKEQSSENAYTVLDYFKFQNDFRGTRATISERQEMYLPYFRDSKGPVLDIGCGRGEFLRLMKDNDIPAFGVDLYPEYVVEGELNGLDIRNGDGVAFLKDADMQFGGIFACQVIEHISFVQLQELCKAAYEKLLPGGHLILETPNPTCLSIYTTTFYTDPTHVKPIHPMLLEYLLREVGFGEVQILFPENSVTGISLPEIEGDGIKNLEEVNRAIRQVSDLLYGCLDYAVIAKK